MKRLAAQDDNSTNTTNSVLVTPTIASFANATHSHQNAAGGGTLDHGLALTGLGDDDHSQYALLAGRSGGQTLKGGTASGDDLTLQSTNHATKGSIFFGAANTSQYDEVNDALILNNSSLGTEAQILRGTSTKTFASDVATRSGILFDGTMTFNAGVGTTNDFYTMHLGGTMDINSQVRSAVLMNLDATIDIGAATTNAIGFQVTPSFIGNTAPTNLRALNLVPLVSPGSAVTYATAVGVYAGLNTVSNNATITDAVAFQPFIGQVGGLGNITNAYGFKVTNADLAGDTLRGGIDIGAITGGATTNFGIRNAGSLRQTGKASFGASGDADATWAIHVIGGNAATAAIGMNTSTTGPANHGTNSGGASISIWKGATNYYFLVSFNDAGTQRYKYIQLNGTGTTWAQGTALPA